MTPMRGICMAGSAAWGLNNQAEHMLSTAIKHTQPLIMLEGRPCRQLG
jgi:hypothetical protein